MWLDWSHTLSNTLGSVPWLFETPFESMTTFKQLFKLLLESMIAFEQSFKQPDKHFSWDNQRRWKIKSQQSQEMLIAVFAIFMIFFLIVWEASFKQQLFKWLLEQLWQMVMYNNFFFFFLLLFIIESVRT